MNENSEEIKKMHQDSIRHVLDMQSRAKLPYNNNFSKNQSSKFHKNSNSSELNNQKKLTEPKKHYKNNEKSPGGLPNLIDLIFKDSEKTLIIILIIILIGEEENFMLVLVLMFLLI